MSWGVRIYSFASMFILWAHSTAVQTWVQTAAAKSCPSECWRRIINGTTRSCFWTGVWLMPCQFAPSILMLMCCEDYCLFFGPLCCDVFAALNCLSGLEICCRKSVKCTKIHGRCLAWQKSRSVPLFWLVPNVLLGWRLRHLLQMHMGFGKR